MLSKISLSLSVVLAVAVCFLFWKISDKKKQDVTDEPVVKLAQAFTGDSVRATVVAYVNGDSLNMNYKFIVEKSKELESKMRAAEERVQKAAGSKQREYNELVAYAQQNPNMPESEAVALENSIGQLQAELDAIQQREVGSLRKKEEELQKELQSRVNKFLESFTKSRGIDYVVNRQEEFQVLLFGNADYDITSEVIAGLNAEYLAELQKNP